MQSHSSIKVPQLNLQKLRGSESQRAQLKLPKISIGNTLPKAPALLKNPEQGRRVVTELHGPSSFRKLNGNKCKAIPALMTPRRIVDFQRKFQSTHLKYGDQSYRKMPLSSRVQNQAQVSDSPEIRDSSPIESPSLSMQQSQQIRPKQDSIRTKNESVSSQFTQLSDDYHNVWDNRDLFLRGVVFDEMEQEQKIQQFLTLLKMRSGGFPGQRENLKNEEIIKMAVHYAKQNKQLFRKYFPTNQVVFENDEDYSQSYNVQDDQNFVKFQDYITQLVGNRNA